MLQALKERFFDIRREEWPRALGLSLFFFLVIAIFWVLKPIKRGLLLGYFDAQPAVVLGARLTGAQAEQVAKVLNMVVAYGVVVAFTALVRHLSRRQLILLFCAAFGVLFVFFASRVGNPGEPLVWALYVTGDIWTTVMVATFWAFSNDITRSDEAERMYGVVGLGGVVGGFVGATAVSRLVEGLGRPTMLLALLVPLALIAVLAVWIDRRARRRREVREGPCCPEDEEGEEGEEDGGEEGGASAAIEGAKLVLSSRYLLGIAALLGLYELVSNITDFQLATVVEQSVQGTLAKDAFFGQLGQITGLLSIGVQLFGTTYVLRNWGVGVALLFLPGALLMGSAGFLIVPTLLLASFMRVSDNALNYSINQSSKEALYTPTSRDAKYKAKAFIDMFIQRAGKVLAVGVNLLLSAVILMDVRWLSLVSGALVLVWILVARYLGKEFRERSEEPAAARVGA